MDYWASNIWLFVLCLWVAFLVFSADRQAAKISAVWLLSYSFAAPVIDWVFPLTDNQTLVQTFCGLIGAAASYRAAMSGRVALARLFATASICHFAYFLILSAGSNIGALFFVTFYTIEVLVVFFSLGVVNVNRVGGSVGGSVGSGFYDDRGRHQ